MEPLDRLVTKNFTFLGFKGTGLTCKNISIFLDLFSRGWQIFIDEFFDLYILYGLGDISTRIVKVSNKILLTIVSITRCGSYCSKQW